MYKNNQLANAVRLALTFGAVAVAGVTTSAMAAEEELAKVERIEVTGSRIIRAEFASSSPVSVFDSADLVKAGVTGVDEFLKDVPAFTGYQMGTSTNNGSDSGQKKIDLRGLGFNRTLVLINGRRQIGDVNGDGAVDLNAIPMSMVKRIEVLKDGASTIYGADAIAGVVNVILHDRFEGVEFQAGYGAGTGEWDAENKSVSFMAGASSGKGHMVVAMEYNRQHEMLQGDRSWATEALYPNLQDDGSFLAVGSGSSNGRKIAGLSGSALDAIEASLGRRVTNFVYDGSTGKARPLSAATDLYNYAPVNALVTPNERWQFAANATYDLTDTTQAFMETLYTRRTSQQRLAPDASFAVTPGYVSKATGLGQWNDLVPASNPFNPFGDFAAGADGVMGTADDLNPWGISGESVRANRRFVESGGRLFRQSADTFRMVAGLKGELADGIYWDFSYTFAENETINDTKNYHRFDRWEVAVNPTLCASDPRCAAAGVLNPFSEYGGISPEQMAFLSANSLKDWYLGEMRLFQANISGDDLGIELSGGSIGWALGYEQRYEKGSFTPDEFVSEGLTTGGAGDPLSGGFSVKELYGELYVPILDTLVMETSVRHSKYNTSAGNSTNFKIGFDWQALDDLRFRAGYATGFRAPNIAELNQQQSTGFPIVEPLCEFMDIRQDISDTVRANCTALDAYTGEFGFAWQSAYTTLAPATPLKPEESKSLTLGAVYQVSAIEGLTFGIDYWNIKVENYIGETPFNDLFRSCLESENLSAPSCSAFASTGVISDGFPGDATSAFGNLGEVNTDGIDFDVVYDTPVNLGGVNRFTWRLAGTFVNSREEIWPVVGARETVGTANGFAVFPEWRLNTSVGIAGDNWTAQWNIRYIGETTDALRPAQITDDHVAEAMTYHDLVGSYSYNNVTLSMGVNNVLDKNPPRFHSAFNANTEPGMYDVIGRRLFANVKVAF